MPTSLVVSYMGYKNEEISVYEVTDDELEISLTENFNILQGVVIVGYGTQKRENLSGSVSTVDVDNIKKGGGGFGQQFTGRLYSRIDGSASLWSARCGRESPSAWRQLHPGWQ